MTTLSLMNGGYEDTLISSGTVLHPAAAALTVARVATGADAVTTDFVGLQQSQPCWTAHGRALARRGVAAVGRNHRAWPRYLLCDAEALAAAPVGAGGVGARGRWGRGVG